MVLENLLEKPVWQMTGEEFLYLLKNNITKETANNNSINNNADTSQKKKYVYGIRGIANLLDCSISTANRIKKRGVIDDAIIQQGRTIIVDAEKALELLKENSN